MHLPQPLIQSHLILESTIKLQNRLRKAVEYWGVIRQRKVMEASWENLLPPLLELILDRLPVPDYLRFAAVCPSWHRVQTDHRLRRAPSANRNRQMPWLMLHEQLQSPQQRLFYNPSEQRFYLLPRPTIAAKSRLLRGVSHGWLLFLAKTFLVLVNPFTGSEIQIPTPSSPALKFAIFGALTSSPLEPECIVLLGVYGSTNYFFYCRIIDKKWKELIMLYDADSSTRLSDLVRIEHLPAFPAFCGGKLYIDMGGGSKLIVVEPLAVPVKSCLDMAGLPRPKPNTRTFLVESHGLLLLVRLTLMKLEFNGVTMATDIKRFDIFKSDLIQNVWVKLDSLGDRVLFLSHDHCLCLPAVHAGGAANQIYYTFHVGLAPGTLWMQYDYGSHQVVARKFMGLREDSDPSFMFNNIYWVVPSLR